MGQLDKFEEGKLSQKGENKPLKSTVFVATGFVFPKNWKRFFCLSIENVYFREQIVENCSHYYTKIAELPCKFMKVGVRA
jgi:hypothetical protein